MENRVAWNKGRVIGQKAPLKPSSETTTLKNSKNTKHQHCLQKLSKIRGCYLLLIIDSIG
jgi:hypothetical protein